MRTLRRLFIIYISFFLCALLLILPFLNLIVADAEQRTLRTNEEVLSAGLQRLEDELRLATAAANTIYASSLMRPMRYSLAPLPVSQTYPVMQAKRFFAEITQILNTPSDVGIIYKNGGVLASGLFHQDMETYYRSSFQAQEAQTAQAFLDAITREGASHTFTPLTVKSHATREALVFALSLPLNSANWRSAVFFAVFDARDIIDMLMLPNMMEHTSLTVTGPDGGELLRYDPGDMDAYVTVSKTGTLYKLTVEQRISRTVIHSVLQGFFRLVAIFVLVYILLGIALAVVYAYRNAKPINAMINTASKVGAEAGDGTPPAGPEEYASGYQYVSAVLDKASTCVKNHRVALESQEMLLCENLYERLLRGEVFSETTFRIAGQYLTDIPACGRMVILQLLQGGGMNLVDYSTLRVSMMAAARELLPRDTSVHFSSNMMVLMLSCEHGFVRNLEACAQFMQSLSDAIATEAGVETRIAISAPMEGIRAMGRVFRQLRHLLRIKGAASRLLLWEEYQPAAVMPDTSKQNSRRFYEHVLRGNAQTALKLLEEDIGLLRHMALASEADVMQLFYIYRHALSLVEADFAFLETRPLPHFVAFDSLDDTFESIREGTMRICRQIKENQAVDEECFERKVLRFIDENIANPDLYAPMIASQFGISESSLQRLMRRATSGSFFEYVEAGRMKRARHLLQETDEPLADVVAQCGYVSSNSFYKAFRRTYGMSPTAMRNAHKNGKEG